jgi:hypothetical protein
MPRFGLIAGLLLLTVATYFISSGTSSIHHAYTTPPRLHTFFDLSLSLSLWLMEMH